MKTSNPVLSRLGQAAERERTAGYAPAGPYGPATGQPGYGQPGYGQPYPTGAAGFPAAPPTVQPMTIDDVVVKTVTLLGVTGISAVAAWNLIPDAVAGPAFFGAAIVGLVLGLVISFKQITKPAPIIAYAAIEGVFLGGISHFFNDAYPGIVVQAVLCTGIVTAVMLGLYRSGRIRVTPKFTRMVIGATLGFFALIVVNLVAGFFMDGGLGLREGPLGILVGLFAIGLASLNLVLDFDLVERGARQGLPARYGWFAAFAIMITLVWLYIEILRLLAILRGD